LEGAPAEGEPAAVATGRVEFVRREHMQFSSAATEKAFLQLAAGQGRTREEIIVLSRLLNEKKMEKQKFEADLQKEFAVDPKGNYHYSEGDNVLYELTLSPDAADGATSSNAPAFQRKEHRQLKDQDVRQRFLNLVSAKQLSSEGERVLGLLLKEKRLELAAVQAALQAQFSVLPEKSYEYDREARQVYELVSVPSPEGAPGPEPAELFPEASPQTEPSPPPAEAAPEPEPAEPPEKSPPEPEPAEPPEKSPPRPEPVEPPHEASPEPAPPPAVEPAATPPAAEPPATAAAGSPTSSSVTNVVPRRRVGPSKPGKKLRPRQPPKAVPKPAAAAEPPLEKAPPATGDVPVKIDQKGESE
jgi:hypothetical protein